MNEVLGDDVLVDEARVDKGGGRGSWTRVVDEARGRGSWTRVVEEARGRSSWTRVVEEARGRGLWTRLVDEGLVDGGLIQACKSGFRALGCHPGGPVIARSIVFFRKKSNGLRHDNTPGGGNQVTWLPLTR